MDDKNVLNLDEMLGQKSLKVTWKGDEYVLKTSTDLSPEEYMEIMALGEKFTGFANAQNSAEAGKEITAAVNRMMGIVAPELSAKGIPFSGQMLVLTFWKEQQQQDASSKKKPAKSK
jgi:hypothetical protein